MLRQPHPRYGFLDMGKFEALNLLKCALLTSDELVTEDIGVGWCVCVLGHEHPEVQRAIAENDPGVLRPIWSSKMHASEAAPFVKWFNQSFEEADAAITEEKPKKGEAPAAAG